MTTCACKLQALSPEIPEAELLAALDTALDDIVAALERDERAGCAVCSASSAGRSRGRQRHRLHAGIENLARDFGTLCDAILTVAISKDASFTPREYQVLNQTIDDGIAAAVQEYWYAAQKEQEHEASERLGMLVHELRNALATAIVSARVVTGGQVASGGKTGAVLERALSRMRDLVEQALTAVKVRACALPERRRVRIVDLLRDIESAAIPERGVTVRVEATDDVELDADPALLTSAVSNLVQNAVKFTHPGTTVTLRANASDGHVLIEVEDECGGLPEGRGEELFEPFVQAGSDRRGVGLGLAIVREAARAHGGEAHVRSMPGKGCVFSLDLPRTTPGANAPRLSRSA